MDLLNLNTVALRKAAAGSSSRHATGLLAAHATMGYMGGGLSETPSTPVLDTPSPWRVAPLSAASVSPAVEAHTPDRHRSSAFRTFPTPPTPQRNTLLPTVHAMSPERHSLSPPLPRISSPFTSTGSREGRSTDASADSKRSALLSGSSLSSYANSQRSTGRDSDSDNSEDNLASVAGPSGLCLAEPYGTCALRAALTAVLRQVTELESDNSRLRATLAQLAAVQPAVAATSAEAAEASAPACLPDCNPAVDERAPSPSLKGRRPLLTVLMTPGSLSAEPPPAAAAQASSPKAVPAPKTPRYAWRRTSNFSGPLLPRLAAPEGTAAHAAAGLAAARQAAPLAAQPLRQSGAGTCALQGARAAEARAADPGPAAVSSR